MNWIDVMQGLALFYTLAGAGTVALTWTALLSQKHGWFRFRHCSFNLRRQLYGNRSMLALWIREIFAACLATLVFFIFWPLVLPATMQGKGQ